MLFSAQCSVGSHTITLVGVVLGGPNHPTVDGKVRSLIAQATAGFHELALAKAGESFASYSTPWGDKSAAVAARDVSAVVWGSTPISLTVRAKAMPLASAGTAAGQAEFRIGGQRVRVPLQLSESIDDPGPWWRLTNPGELF
ncbi:MAG: hypothetical protein EPN91_12130 [Salinibacterium sp.]|nr:MAG: hypothetical protein EPN91_12130 [Salinibacterium sp.]